ncbi:MAG: phosphoenolpyruvate carboxykinase, partial [Phycisphaerae bacterium]|nr:phosphoenolpyruvate carboxykinase [Phycisphaerae bacterium]
MDTQSILKSKMDEISLSRLLALKNEEANAFVARAIELCEPDRVWVGTDSAEDAAYCRQLAIDNKEELPLSVAGHTAHFDSYYDQGRNPEVTKYLVPKSETLDPKLK